jgi:acyl carrier protein
MDRDSLRQALAQLVEQETGIKPENVGDEVTLTEGLGMDSIDLVGLVVQVENRFRIKIATEELRSLRQVGELLTLLQKKISTSDTEPANASPAPTS